MKLTGSILEKLTDRSKLADICREYRKAGETVCFTNGCFDLIHAGHVRLLEQSASFADILIVAINSDDSLRRLKGPGRPIMDEESRAIVLGSLAMVDHIVVFHEDTPDLIIKELLPDVLVKGGDYRPHEVVGRDTVENNGGRLELIRLVEGKSTTSIIKHILKYKDQLTK